MILKKLKFLGLFFPFMFLIACSSESPMSEAEDDIDYMDQAMKEALSSSANQKKFEACAITYNVTCCNYCFDDYGYYECHYCTGSSSSSYTSYYSSSSYYPSPYSSSSYYTSNATSSKKTMKLTLTYYLQVSRNWDPFDGAGDPMISFLVETYSDGTLMQKTTTEKLLDEDNLRVWRGTSSTTIPIAAGIDEIRIYPIVIDEDVSSHDDYSSGYYFIRRGVGYLKNFEVVEQSDYMGDDYELEWNWYLY